MTKRLKKILKYRRSEEGMLANLYTHSTHHSHRWKKRTWLTEMRSGIEKSASTNIINLLNESGNIKIYFTIFLKGHAFKIFLFQPFTNFFDVEFFNNFIRIFLFPWGQVQGSEFNYNNIHMSGHLSRSVFSSDRHTHTQPQLNFSTLSTNH